MRPSPLKGWSVSQEERPEMKHGLCESDDSGDSHQKMWQTLLEVRTCGRKGAQDIRAITSEDPEKNALIRMKQHLHMNCHQPLLSLLFTHSPLPTHLSTHQLIHSFIYGLSTFHLLIYLPITYPSSIHQFICPIGPFIQSPRHSSINPSTDLAPFSSTHSSTSIHLPT